VNNEGQQTNILLTDDLDHTRFFFGRQLQDKAIIVGSNVVRGSLLSIYSDGEFARFVMRNGFGASPGLTQIELSGPATGTWTTPVLGLPAMLSNVLRVAISQQRQAQDGIYTI
jgi:hypothetical protein